MMILRSICFVTAALLFASPALAEKTWHVSKTTGKNKNDGSKDKPLKNIDKAVKKAKAGDTILVAEGVYSGTFNIGYVEFKVPVKLYGGYATDFSSRDPIAHPTVFQPDNKSGAKSRKALFQWKSGSKTQGVVIDGFVFDMGMRNAYSTKKGKPDGVETGMLLLPPAKEPGQKATVTEPCVSFRSGSKGGDITISNNVFANCASFGVQAAFRKGYVKVTNNVFVSNRMAAIEVFGTCPRPSGKPKAQSKCGQVEYGNNTILFTWSRLKDFLDMGYGTRMMTQAEYNVHHNIIGASILSGVDHSRFTPVDWIKLDNNVFFANKQSALHFVPESNTTLNLTPDQFDDLEYASVTGNKFEIPKTLVLDKKYLAGFLAARYSEKADYNPDSPANQMRSLYGLNKQGKLKTKVSMYANRYPWKEAIKLFGAVSGVGAQKPAKK